MDSEEFVKYHVALTGKENGQFFVKPLTLRKCQLDDYDEFYPPDKKTVDSIEWMKKD